MLVQNLVYLGLFRHQVWATALLEFEQAKREETRIYEIRYLERFLRVTEGRVDCQGGLLEGNGPFNNQVYMR